MNPVGATGACWRLGSRTEKRWFVGTLRDAEDAWVAFTLIQLAETQ